VAETGAESRGPWGSSRGPVAWEGPGAGYGAGNRAGVVLADCFWGGYLVPIQACGVGAPLYGLA
jgi:hypothetical protein